MASCILDLYRSATKVQDAWGPDFVDIPKPGMVIVPSRGCIPRRRGREALSGQGRGSRDRAVRARPLVDAPRPRPRCRGPRGVLGERLTARRVAALGSVASGREGEADRGRLERGAGQQRRLQRHRGTDRADRRASDDLTDRIGLAHGGERGRADIGLDHRDDPRAVERALQRSAAGIEEVADRREEEAAGETEDHETDDLHAISDATIRVSVRSLVISLTRRRANVERRDAEQQRSDVEDAEPRQVGPSADRGEVHLFDVLRLPQAIEGLARRAREGGGDGEQHQRAAAPDRAEPIPRRRAQRGPRLALLGGHAGEARLRHREDQPEAERDLQQAAGDDRHPQVDVREADRGDDR